MSHSLSANAANFPVKSSCIYLNNCGVAPLYSGAAKAAAQFSQIHSQHGAGAFARYPNTISDVHQATANLLSVQPGDISFTKNTAEAMNLLANGYPFERGDRIISYIHEYPSNHYPWRLQENRGVELLLLQDSDPLGDLSPDRPRGWSLSELSELIDERTRIVALSHVQFTSGFAADLKELGRLCRERNVDLIIDAAQSLGCMPLYPEDFGIAAVAASGWKWLLGPIGSGLLYTSAEFREKISLRMVGADTMIQGQDYLNHDWVPHSDGRKFEYSTMTISAMIGLTTCLNDLFARDTIESVFAENIRRQDLFLSLLDCTHIKPVLFDQKNRSGILSLVPEGDEELIAANLREKGVFVTCRGGYLRIAPHLYNDDEEIKRAADLLNTLL